MTFIRSPEGLSNMHLFYDVNCVLFVEGSRSIPAESIGSGMEEQLSDDGCFWSTLTAWRIPELTLKVLPVGSKAALRKIAEHVVSDRIEFVAVALDRDYDHVTGKKLIHPRILYTRGHSWENDVWDCLVIAETAHTLSRSHESLEHLIPRVLEELGCFAASVRWPVRANVLVASINDELLLTNDRPAQWFSFALRKKPVFRRDRLRQSLELMSPSLARDALVPVAKCPCLLDIPGAILSCFAYHLVVHLASTIRGMKCVAPRHVVTGIGMKMFQILLCRGELAGPADHYGKMLDALALRAAPAPTT